MKRIRVALATVIVLLLIVGYAASQMAYFNGSVDVYAAKIDQPEIVLLALVLFVACVVLGYWPSKEDDRL